MDSKDIQTGKESLRLWRGSLRRTIMVCFMLGCTIIALNWTNIKLDVKTAPGTKQVWTNSIYVRGPVKRSSQSSISNSPTNPIDEKRNVPALLENKVYLYSAIAINSSQNRAYWDNIVINGWEHKTFNAVNYTCCLVYDTIESGVVTQPVLNKRPWPTLGKATLRSMQWVCPNAETRLPLSVSLTKLNDTYPGNKDAYVKVEPAYKLEDGTLGVCGKLVYDNKSADSIIEWMEFQRLMKVDKILMYTNNLNDEADSVLQYYRKLGIAELYTFELGGNAVVARDVGVKSYQGWNDEQVTVMDCQCRLSGATYIALYDLDEFIYSFRHTDYKHMMHNLTSQFTNAAGFTFKTQIYVTNWNQTNSLPASSLVLGRYTRRTRTMMDRVKNFARVDRLLPGRMYTHGYWAKAPFKKKIVQESFAVLKHYRSCRKEWLRNGGERCFRNITQIEDTTMVPMATKLEKHVDVVKHELGLVT